jgi:uncharacterized protein
MEEDPMTISLYDVTVPVFVRGFDNLAAVLAKGRAFGEAEGIDAAELLGARLAPDMMTLTGQIQRASDTAKFAAVRIGGVANERFADDEKSFEDLQDRIARTRAFLLAVPRAAIDDNAESMVSLNIGRASATVPGRAYALQFALPNFFFHVTTAYNLLRQRGVPLGKMDYIGSLAAS